MAAVWEEWLGDHPLVVLPPTCLVCSPLSNSASTSTAAPRLSMASVGARAAAAENGTRQTCHQAAVAFAASVGDALTNPQIACTVTATHVTVRVTTAPSR